MTRVPPVEFAGLTVGGGAPLLLIGGPCVIESEAHAIETALQVRDSAVRAGVQDVFHASDATSIGLIACGRARAPGTSS